MMKGFGEVMIFEETAKYLKIGKSTLYNYKNGKGRKDRYTILSKSVLVVLRKYYGQYRPEKWLFEGVKQEKHISTRTVQAIFKHTCEKAGIKKKVSAYSLRHSFATHKSQLEKNKRAIFYQR